MPTARTLGTLAPHESTVVAFGADKGRLIARGNSQKQSKQDGFHAAHHTAFGTGWAS